MISTDIMNISSLFWLFFCSGLTFWFINSPLTNPLLSKIEQPIIKQIVGCSFCVGFFICIIVYPFASIKYRILDHFIFAFGGAAFIHLLLSFMDRPTNNKEIIITPISEDKED